MKRIVIIRATSAIAQECAKLWLKQSPKDLTLLVRDANKAQRLVEDLQVRSPQSKIKIVQTGFINVVEIEKTVRDIANQGSIDIDLIAHGTLPEQSACQNDLALCKETLEVNAISPVLFAESLASVIEKANQGTIAIIGSVTGDRGRKSNYVYGAAKGLVSRYGQGLQHRFSRTRIKVIIIKPGPTDTPMTRFYKQKGVKMASAESVANSIVLGIEKGKAVIYTPRKWCLIMVLIQHLPNFIFNKINI
jgi:short-subunit dehydrogenase